MKFLLLVATLRNLEKLIAATNNLLCSFAQNQTNLLFVQWYTRFLLLKK